MPRLAGKVAIITGGARGIGKATAELFAKEGAKVIIWDMLEVGEATANDIHRQGYECSFMKVSVTDVPLIEAATEAVFQQYGRIDILVNNAGITRDKSLLKMSYQEWQQVIDINLSGVFNCTKTVVPYMIKNQFGRILCASSVVGVHGNFGQTNYAATKAGVIAMCRTWAKELGKYGITSNAIAPGFIKTDMTDAIPPEVQQKVLTTIPTGKIGDPMDIATAYLFLASDEASYINGQVLGVNGGSAL
jgi:3-oxoacyl-[acyl-carrier protein] reductase